MTEFKMNAEEFKENTFTVRYLNGKFAEFQKLEGVKNIKHDKKNKNKLILEKEDEIILTNDEDNHVLGIYSNIQNIHWLEKKE